ncbi:nitroreductase family protein [Moraxella sp. Tifton1]|uniref:Nitroreductase family protein n=1 Tax=Moraxella oculi TaxID=2940516 RepID=A0ABW8U6S8_9GAMM|nr:nitroreductase family protein [Moraxella sp. Tifton1]MCL1623892.1 nitroreductase family protein [Moraxella sp. Tifton1]
MSLYDILTHRRSVRDYLPTPIDESSVRQCLELATLAPTSSNMQLYECYHVVDKSALAKLAKACLSQSAATTAPQMVVFVIRPDLHRMRAKAVFEFEQQNIKTYSPSHKVATRIKRFNNYYNRLMPLLYSQSTFVPTARLALAHAVGCFRPIQRDVSFDDLRVVMHKSCGLVAQTFMLAMSEKGLDTCPMEGFDANMVKDLLNLPKSCEITMVVSCGIRSDVGVWGERFRVPFDEVYRKV